MRRTFMKTKKITLLASTLLGVTLLSSCGAASTVTFSPNWCPDVTNEHSSEGETLTYEVTFKADATTDVDNTRTVVYGTGEYVTTLTPTASGTETRYVYTTSLTIPVTYTYHGADGNVEDTFEDEITSEVVFRSTTKGLKPVSSKKTIISHTPSYSPATSLDTCYKKYWYELVTSYDDNAENGTCVLTDRLGNIYGAENGTRSTSFSMDKGYTYVDNEQLLFAIRCLPLNSSAVLTSYNDSAKSVEKVNVNLSSVEEDEFTFSKNGNPYTKKLTYVPVSISRNTGNHNTGATHRLWIAQKTEGLNENRNVMLKMEVPVSYSIGTLVYTLKSANFN